MFNEDQFTIKKPTMGTGIFAIRGELDGEEHNEFADVRQFIGLVIGGEEFLLPIESVSEIIMLNGITYVPGARKVIEGVINLRGLIIPAVSLRKLMGLSLVPPDSHNRIIIARHEEVRIGLIVDAITYVASLNPASIEAHSLASAGTKSELISEIGKRGDQVNGILDIGKVIITLNGGKSLELDDEAS